MKTGDRIISFNGTVNPTWDSINGDALLSPGQSLPLTVNRNGQEVTLTIRPTPRTENGETAGFLEFIPDYGGLPVVVNEVSTSSPAQDSGFQAGDRVLSVGGEPVKSAAQITEYIHSHDGQAIPFEIERKGQKTELTSVTRRLPGALLGLKLGEQFPLHRVGVPSGIALHMTRTCRSPIDWKSAGQVFTASGQYATHCQVDWDLSGGAKVS